MNKALLSNKEFIFYKNNIGRLAVKQSCCSASKQCDVCICIRAASWFYLSSSSVSLRGKQIACWPATDFIRSCELMIHVAKAAEFPRKPLLERVLAETGASAKSVWLITTDAPLQVFRVRSLVLGLEGQTIAPVPHKIAHSCIFNEAWGQMVWNDIIQYLAVLRQRKSSASTTMALYLRGEGRTLPKCPAHICSTSFSDSSRSSWQ